MQATKQQGIPSGSRAPTTSVKNRPVEQDEGGSISDIQTMVLVGEELIQCIEALEAMLQEAPSWKAPADPEGARLFLTGKRQELVQISWIIVNSFNDGMKDFERHGCSDRMRWWIGDMVQTISKHGMAPRPLDLSIFKNPRFTGVVAKKKKRQTSGVVRRGEGDARLGEAVDVEMKDATGSKGVTPDPVLAKEGSGNKVSVGVDNSKGKGVIRPPPLPVRKHQAESAGTDNKKMNVDLPQPAQGGRPKQTPWPKKAELTLNDSEDEGEGADSPGDEEDIVPRAKAAEGSDDDGDGSGSLVKDTNLLQDDTMLVDGVPRKRKTPQRDSDEEEEEEDVPLAQTVPSKKRKVQAPTGEIVVDKMEGDELGDTASTTSHPQLPPKDGVDRTLININGVQCFAVPCSAWCLPNKKTCKATSGPKIACDRCRKSKQMCEKSWKRKKPVPEGSDKKPRRRKVKAEGQEADVVNPGEQGRPKNAGLTSEAGPSKQDTIWTVDGREKIMFKPAAGQSADTSRSASRISTRSQVGGPSKAPAGNPVEHDANRVRPANAGEGMIELEDVILEVSSIKETQRAQAEALADMKGQVWANVKEMEELDGDMGDIRADWEATDEMTQETMTRVKAIEMRYPAQVERLTERIAGSLQPKIDSIDTALQENHAWAISKVEELNELAKGKILPKLSDCLKRDHDGLSARVEQLHARLDGQQAAQTDADSSADAASERPGVGLIEKVNTLERTMEQSRKDGRDELREQVAALTTEMSTLREELQAQFRALQASLSQGNPLLHETLSACLKLSEAAVRLQFERRDPPATDDDQPKHPLFVFGKVTKAFGKGSVAGALAMGVPAPISAPPIAGAGTSLNPFPLTQNEAIRSNIPSPKPSASEKVASLLANMRAKGDARREAESLKRELADEEVHAISSGSGSVSSGLDHSGLIESSDEDEVEAERTELSEADFQRFLVLGKQSLSSRVPASESAPTSGDGPSTTTLPSEVEGKAAMDTQHTPSRCNVPMDVETTPTPAPRTSAASLADPFTFCGHSVSHPIPPLPAPPFALSLSSFTDGEIPGPNTISQRAVWGSIQRARGTSTGQGTTTTTASAVLSMITSVSKTSAGKLPDSTETTKDDETMDEGSGEECVDSPPWEGVGSEHEGSGEGECEDDEDAEESDDDEGVDYDPSGADQALAPKDDVRMEDNDGGASGSGRDSPTTMSTMTTLTELEAEEDRALLNQTSVSAAAPGRRTVPTETSEAQGGARGRGRGATRGRGKNGALGKSLGRGTQIRGHGRVTRAHPEAE